MVNFEKCFKCYENIIILPNTKCFIFVFSHFDFYSKHFCIFKFSKVVFEFCIKFIVAIVQCWVSTEDFVFKVNLRFDGKNNGRYRIALVVVFCCSNELLVVDEEKEDCSCMVNAVGRVLEEMYFAFFII